MKITLIICVVIAFLILQIHAVRYNKKAYNEGICRKCGGAMKNVDMDSQGNTFYECVKCDNKIWVSYGVDMK